MPRTKSEKTKKVESLLGRLREAAWEPLDTDIKERFTFVGYAKARTYVKMVLFKFTLPELNEITDHDLAEMLLHALEGQTEHKKSKKEQK